MWMICIAFISMVFVLILLIRKQMRDSRSVKSLQHWKEEEEAFLADAVSSRNTEEFFFDEKVHQRRTPRSPVSLERSSGALSPSKNREDPFSGSLHEVKSADKWDSLDIGNKREPSLDPSYNKTVRETDDAFPESEEMPWRRRKRK